MHPSPPPPPPLPLQNVEHVAVQPMRHNPAPIEASSGGSIAEQVVAKQKEMQKRREANANDGNGGIVYENQHNEAIPSQPSDPHMQALFAAIHRRAEIVEEQIVLEHRRLEEEQVNPSSIVIVEITEEERKQLQLLADTDKGSKKTRG